MWSWPDGYGSISSMYDLLASASPGSGLATSNACSSSQTRCHFASIAFGSYFSITVSGYKKASRERGRGKLPRRGRVRFLR